MKVNDRVLVQHVYRGTIINISDYRPPESKYAIQLDQGCEDLIFVGDMDIIPLPIEDDYPEYNLLEINDDTFLRFVEKELHTSKIRLFNAKNKPNVTKTELVNLERSVKYRERIVDLARKELEKTDERAD